MSHKFKTTTVLMMSAALAFPGPVVAGNHTSKGLEMCGDPIEPPCLTEDGAKLTRGQPQGLPVCDVDAEIPDGLPCVTEDGFMKVELEDGDMAEGEMDSEVEAEAEAEAEAEVEAEVEAEAETEVEADTNAEAEVEAETEVEADAESSTDMSGDSTDSDAAAAANATANATAEADTSVEANATAEADTSAETDAMADTASSDTESSDGDTTADADASATAETQTSAETDSSDTPTESDIVQVGEDDTTGDSSGDMVQIEEDTEASTDSTVANADEPVESEPAESVAAAGADEAPTAAAAASADAAEGASEVEVQTVEVTEENSRSADEDFDTAVTGESTSAATDGTATASASASSDDDNGGRSDFERALLLGLGAAAVGAILNNGDEVMSNSGDRVVVRRDGELRVLKDDDALLRQPGSQVQTETFNDGSTRTTVTREDGTQIVTIRSAEGSVLRRTRVFQDGTRVVLFDDTETSAPVDVARLQSEQTEGQTSGEIISIEDADEDALRRALEAAQVRDTGRTYSLRQIRQISEVRALAPQIELDAVNFSTGSAAIQPSEAEELAALGRAMRDVIADNPGEVFLIEGHTDTVGDATYNLALSDRRAETVALALSQYFDVPPENMVTQGYGESQLKVEQEGDIRANRRATVRRITPLLASAN